jgi:hypothetical protein
MSADGTKYEGDFVEGKKHGYGTYTFSEGSVYQVPPFLLTHPPHNFALIIA